MQPFWRTGFLGNFRRRLPPEKSHPRGPPLRGARLRSSDHTAKRNSGGKTKTARFLQKKSLSAENTDGACARRLTARTSPCKPLKVTFLDKQPVAAKVLASIG